jgi:hypothetical protein
VEQCEHPRGRGQAGAGSLPPLPCTPPFPFLQRLKVSNIGNSRPLICLALSSLRCPCRPIMSLESWGVSRCRKRAPEGSPGVPMPAQCQSPVPGADLESEKPSLPALGEKFRCLPPCSALTTDSTVFLLGREACTCRPEGDTIHSFRPEDTKSPHTKAHIKESFFLGHHGLH